MLYRISLSGLLNALDGVGAQEGRILYATTNKYTALDPALCRPGRMDIHVEFKLASKFQAQELFRCFYLPSDDAADDVDDDDQIEKESLDSGYSSSDNLVRDLIEFETSSDKSGPAASSAPSLERPSFIGHSHRSRAPKLSRRQVRELADRFSDMIPEREFSMASLQGYLMTYKTRPFDAVKEIGAWIQKEYAERAERQKVVPSPLAASAAPTPDSSSDDGRMP